MNRQKKYASHLPVLKLIFDFVDVKNVFEYGCGIYSTKFFTERASLVTSVEMTRVEWYEKVKKEIVSDKLNLLFMLGDTASVDYFNKETTKYDMVFVDGQARLDCTKNAFGKTDIIVIHDLSARWYGRKSHGWVTMNVPNDYKMIIMNIAHPPTAIYTSNEKLFNELKKYKSTVFKD